MAESKEELKSHYMKVKEESESIGLKFSFQKTKIMASGPISPWQIDAETMKTVSDLFSWVPKSLQMVTVATKVKDTCSFEEKLWKTYRHCFANKNLYSQSYVFSSSHAWMWELNHKESWAPKNGYFWTVVLQKTLSLTNFLNTNCHPWNNRDFKNVTSLFTLFLDLRCSA